MKCAHSEILTYSDLITCAACGEPLGTCAVCRETRPTDALRPIDAGGNLRMHFDADGSVCFGTGSRSMESV